MTILEHNRRMLLSPLKRGRGLSFVSYIGVSHHTIGDIKTRMLTTSTPQSSSGRWWQAWWRPYGTLYRICHQPSRLEHLAPPPLMTLTIVTLKFACARSCCFLYIRYSSSMSHFTTRLVFPGVILSVYPSDPEYKKSLYINIKLK